MKFEEALSDVQGEGGKKFQEEFGKVKSFIDNYPYGQEGYLDLDTYKQANQAVSKLQLGAMRNMKDWDKIVEKARSFLNKMAHDFGDFYKGKLNVKWHDAMQALDRMEGNNGK